MEAGLILSLLGLRSGPQRYNHLLPPYQNEPELDTNPDHLERGKKELIPLNVIPSFSSPNTPYCVGH